MAGPKTRRNRPDTCLRHPRTDAKSIKKLLGHPLPPCLRLCKFGFCCVFRCFPGFPVFLGFFNRLFVWSVLGRSSFRPLFGLEPLRGVREASWRKRSSWAKVDKPCSGLWDLGALETGIGLQKGKVRHR